MLHVWSALNAQCICQLDNIRQSSYNLAYSTYQLVYITLIITIAGLSQLDIELVTWVSVDLNIIGPHLRLESSDSYCCSLLHFLCIIVSTSCAHCYLFHIPILIHRWQLIINCATTHHIFPNKACTSRE